MSLIIINPLTKIFYFSFLTGKVLNSLKVAKVLLLFKAGDAGLFSNYRPVSILPVFSRILEKLFHSRISKYVNKHNILSSSQYGFRDESSNTLALLDMLEDISTAVENKQITIGVFIDLKKALFIYVQWVNS